MGIALLNADVCVSVVDLLSKIILECPGCGETKPTARDADVDPPEAFTLVAPCVGCRSHGPVPVEYRDVLGKTLPD